MLFALCSSVEAQQQARIPKIGWLGVRPAASDTGRELFGREFRALGYVEGKNIIFEYRSADDKLDRLPALADELVRLKVDVLLASLTPAAVAAKNATRTIPIVFHGGFDPVALGLVDSLARPGGNVTGFTAIAPALIGKRLELLKETVPKLSRLAVLWDPQNPGSAQQWKESQLPARELSLQLYSIEVSSADRFGGAFKEATKARSNALAVMASPFFYTNQQRTCGPRDKKSTAGDLPSARFCRERRLDVLWSRPIRALQAGCVDGRQDFERCEACRSASGAATKVRAGHKSESREADRPDDPAERAGERGQGDQVTNIKGT